MRIVTLGASQPLTKHFSLKNRNLQVTPYPHVLNFTSQEHSVETIEQFFELIQTEGEAGKCLLKGLLTQPLNNEPRAGKHLLEEPTEWLVLDFDDLHGIDDIDEALEALELRQFDHVLQYSASMGINPKKALSAHVFFLLNEPVSPNRLKQWLTHQNLTVPLFAQQLRLTRSGMALSWPIDVTVAQNDKLIYISPPSLDPSTPDLVDSLLEPRLQLRKRFFAKLDVIPLAAPDTSSLKHDRINQLREACGLPARAFQTKDFFNHEVLKNADPAKQYEVAQVARGYVYLNLNGGDSRGYYHPCDNPEIIFNFKGEPNYATKELLPEYYEQARKAAKDYRQLMRDQAAQRNREAREQVRREAQAAAREARAENADAKLQETIEEFDELPDPNGPDAQNAGIRFFVAEDKQTGKYWKGSYDYPTRTLDITPSRTRQSLVDFALANTGIRPAYIPQWDVAVDLHKFERFDPLNKSINLWTPSSYLLAAYQNPPAQPPTFPPPTISKVLDSICSHDPETRAHFLNWIAYVWQYRDKSKTAWIFHGTTGTGKGVFFHKILRPLFGEQLAQIRTLDMLEEPFNGYMSNTLLLFIDESDTDKVKNIHKIVGKVKSWITEPTIAIREMYMGQYQAPSHMNILFASNKHNPMQIDRNDRRFNVAPRQESRLTLSDDEYAQIEDELQDFAHFLTSFAIDTVAARTALDTTAKRNVQETTTDAPQDVADAVMHGNLRFFVDLLPDRETERLLSEDLNPVQSLYRKLLTRIAKDITSQCGDVTLARDELQLMFRYTVGWEASTPHKFTKAIARYGLKLKVNSVNGCAVRSLKTTWHAAPEDLELLEMLNTDRLQPQLRSVK